MALRLPLDFIWGDLVPTVVVLLVETGYVRS